jgi:hypothetical protein
VLEVNYNRVKPMLIINGEEIKNYESTHIIDPKTQNAKWFITFGKNSNKVKENRAGKNRVMQQRVFNRMCEFVIDTHNRISPSDTELTAMVEAAKAVLSFEP